MSQQVPPTQGCAAGAGPPPQPRVQQLLPSQGLSVQPPIANHPLSACSPACRLLARLSPARPPARLRAERRSALEEEADDKLGDKLEELGIAVMDLVPPFADLCNSVPAARERSLAVCHQLCMASAGIDHLPHVRGCKGGAAAISAAALPLPPSDRLPAKAEPDPDMPAAGPTAGGGGLFKAGD